MAFNQVHGGAERSDSFSQRVNQDDSHAQRGDGAPSPGKLFAPLRLTKPRLWKLQNPLVRGPKGTRLRVILLAFAITPIAMIILYLSVTTMVLTAAQGVPLSSYTGAAGLLISTLLLLLVTLTGVADPWGMYVATAWAAIFAFVMPLTWRLGDPTEPQLADSSVVASMSGALMWSYLPSLIFFIFLGASASLTMVQRWKGDSEAAGVSWQPRSGRRRTRVVSVTLSIVLALGLWLVVLGLAPSQIAPLAIFGPLGLTLGEPDLVVVLIACVLALIFALSSAYSTLGIAVAGIFLMAVPGQIVFPLWMTLTGHVANPSSSASASFALASPIMAALGVTLLVVSTPIHFARLAKEAPNDDISAPHPERPNK